MQNCAPTQLFECAQEVFRLTTEGWIDRALGAAQTLFVSLALLEIIVTGYIYWTRRSREQDLIGQFALKLGILAFVLDLLSTYHHWLPLVPKAFGEGAMHIGGDVVTQLSPTHLVNVGLSIFLSTLKALGPNCGHHRRDDARAGPHHSIVLRGARGATPCHPY